MINEYDIKIQVVNWPCGKKFRELRGIYPDIILENNRVRLYAIGNSLPAYRVAEIAGKCPVFELAVLTPEVC